MCVLLVCLASFAPTPIYFALYLRSALLTDLCPSSALPPPQALLQAVKRSRFKELCLRQVQATKLKPLRRKQQELPGGVPFADEFFLQDLLGLGRLRLFRTPGGERLFRLS